ncbi:MAG: A/G-specific adenine glycosylase [Verrucomicrobiota bacterium]|nr:A/G-specific adenine glycosylase [Verrucomicrobiota bacterium]
MKHGFRNALLRWYAHAGRDLPWRRTRDPYAILVSEFMLQQTQVATVIPYYERWLARFPHFHSLAAASESDVLHAWQGLGYYARARNLHAAAKLIASQHDGKFSPEMRLPGVGRYTANAVATFAFDHPVAVVEANIARLLARITNLQISIDSSAGREQLWSVAESLVPKQNAGAFNSALMDLGATICVARQPKCSICPVHRYCRAEDPAKLPIKKARAATKALIEHHAFTTNRGRILLEQATERWRGMWILPRIAPASAQPIYVAQFPFTHHRVTLSVHRARATNGRWFAFDAVDSIPVPSPHRRALDQLLVGSNLAST